VLLSDPRNMIAAARFAGFAGSNRAGGGMHVCRLWLMCFVT